jgi:hypothetical protein
VLSTSRTRSTSACSSRSTVAVPVGRRGDRRRRPDGARLVKAFNTTFAGARSRRGRRPPARRVHGGDDDDAKQAARRSPATAACGRSMPARWRGPELEALGYLHMAVQPALGTAFGSAVAIVP